jgi:hypothetical protein
MTTQELQISRNGQYYVSGDVTFTAAQQVAYLVVNELRYSLTLQTLQT